jgi:hypothetical protein
LDSINFFTVGNVLQRHGLPPAPERKRTTPWSAFIRIHLALLVGTDFFTTEVLTLRGLVTYYVLFFIHLESRRVIAIAIAIAIGLRRQRAADYACGDAGADPATQTSRLRRLRGSKGCCGNTGSRDNGCDRLAHGVLQDIAHC